MRVWVGSLRWWLLVVVRRLYNRWGNQRKGGEPSAGLARIEKGSHPDQRARRICLMGNARRGTMKTWMETNGIIRSTAFSI